MREFPELFWAPSAFNNFLDEEPTEAEVEFIQQVTTKLCRAHVGDEVPFHQMPGCLMIAADGWIIIYEHNPKLTILSVKRSAA